MAESQRILSIDVLRGLTIAFMILVNDPGDGRHTFWPLEHAAWNGWTPTDLVFPTFLFLVGASIVFSVDSRLRRGVSRTSIALQVMRRALIIFAIKMALTIFPYFHMTHLRIFGVLTRIALCYLIAALLYLYLRSANLVLAVSIALLLGYWALMRFVPVPGVGLPTHAVPLLDPMNNLAAWLDRGFNAFCQRFLHTGVLYEGTRDPEGLLSTIPSVATTLIGIWCGRLLRSERQPGRIVLILLATGIVGVCAGLVWNQWFPINKNLWTSSYVLLAAGIAELLLALFFWIFDGLRLQHTSRMVRILAWPWLVFGSNAIAAFVLSNLLIKIALWIKFTTSEGKRISLLGWTYLHLFSHGNSTEMTSLAFALCFVALCFLPVWLLWRRGIFLRV